MFEGIEKVATKNESAEFKTWGTAWFGSLAEITQGGEKPQALCLNQANILSLITCEKNSYQLFTKFQNSI